MDPFSIACGCVSLAASVTNLLAKVTLFALEVRSARKDMDAVSRELMSLKMCLVALEDDEQRRRIALPSEMKKQINEILVNMELIAKQMTKMLLRLLAGGFKTSVAWAFEGKEEMDKLRSSLESNKSALDVALTIGTISILTEQKEQILSQSNAISIIIDQTQTISVTTSKIDQKIDNLTQLQQDHSRFEGLTAEMTQLRAQLFGLTQTHANRQTLEVFVDESRRHTESLLQPLKDLLAEKEQPTINVLEPDKAKILELLDATPEPVGPSSGRSALLCCTCGRPPNAEEVSTATSNRDIDHTRIHEICNESLRRQRDEIVCLTEEVSRLQEAEAAFENGISSRVDDTRKTHSVALNERDAYIAQLLQQVENHKTDLKENADSISRLRKAIEDDYKDPKADSSKLLRLKISDLHEQLDDQSAITKQRFEGAKEQYPKRHRHAQKLEIELTRYRRWTSSRTTNPIEMEDTSAAILARCPAMNPADGMELRLPRCSPCRQALLEYQFNTHTTYDTETGKKSSTSLSMTLSCYRPTNFYLSGFLDRRYPSRHEILKHCTPLTLSKSYRKSIATNDIKIKILEAVADSELSDWLHPDIIRLVIITGKPLDDRYLGPSYIQFELLDDQYLLEHEIQRGDSLCVLLKPPPWGLTKSRIAPYSSPTLVDTSPLQDIESFVSHRNSGILADDDSSSTASEKNHSLHTAKVDDSQTLSSAVNRSKLPVANNVNHEAEEEQQSDSDGREAAWPLVEF